MLPDTFIKGFDQGRLRKLLALIFLALAIPTGVLIWQAYSQLKWEAFHQYRGMAEALIGRIDARLIDMINTADARSFADYTFLVVTGEPSANFVQRSPLSAYPVTADLPGVLGYFQVDSDGAFSTPLLPPAGTNANEFGIGADQYTGRVELARQIQAVLADNALVRSRPEVGFRRGLVPAPETPQALDAPADTEGKEREKLASLESRGRQIAPAARAPAGPGLAGTLSESFEEATVGGFADAPSAAADTVDKLAAKPREPAVSSTETYSQQVFDQLNVPLKSSPSAAATPQLDRAAGEIAQAEQRFNTIGKVSDLKLDAALQKKSEAVERDELEVQRRDGGRAYAPARAKRREQIALPESIRLGEGESVDDAGADRQLAASVLGAASATADLRISTFESEVDPLEFSLLDSGHFVLYRKVWRDGERYIQGFLIDQAAFTRDIIAARFMDTALSDMSSLIVAYQDDVIDTVSGSAVDRYSPGAEALDGALLYRNRLSAPLDSLELIFSIKRLPPGPGASVLGWVIFVLALVFVGGFVALYRLGVGQINLARQQQDFVAAVNHELKTPLTSIRMYGEMLKEGWADEDKRQSYYEFIHDEAERLTRLISNVLQLARFSRNEPQFDLKPVNVGTLLSNIESKIGNQVDRAGFTLKIARDDQSDQANILIDEDCFAQIIINLVDNAIKFSKDAQTKAIEISAKLGKDKRVTFAVRDFGPGVPTDQMKKIFRLFYRSESELTRETVGTGIGLAIVHQLTVAMNGKVDVTNRQPGAEFAVSFPAAA